MQGVLDGILRLCVQRVWNSLPPSLGWNLRLTAAATTAVAVKTATLHHHSRIVFSTSRFINKKMKQKSVDLLSEIFICPVSTVARIFLLLFHRHF